MWEATAKFCPLCAHALEDVPVDGRMRRKCASCGFVMFHNPAPAAAAIVLDPAARRVVLVRRSCEPFPGAWTLPAGYEEADETPIAAAVREAREETGLEVEVRGLFDVLYTSDDPRKAGILIAFLCTPRRGTLRAGSDAAAVDWFGLDALPEPISFRNDRRILARLRRETRDGLAPRILPCDVLCDAGSRAPGDRRDEA